MTLISTFCINEMPVIIGDVAISSHEKLGEARVIPTVGSTWNIFPEGSGYVIIDLKQKINIIDEHLIVAWCGDYVAARSVISRLREINTINKFSYDSIHSFFSNEAKEIIASLNVVFFGYIFEPKLREIRAFDYTFNSGVIQRRHHRRFGEVKVSGSNPDYFLEIIENSSRLSNENSDAFQNCIIETLQFCNISFAREDENLLEYFGGGFEVATFRNERFQKISDISYFSWLCPKPFNIPLLTGKFYKVAYTNDILLVYVATLKKEEQKLIVLPANSEVITYPLEPIIVYPILPVDRDINEEQLINELSIGIPVASSTWNSNLIYLFDECDFWQALSHTIFCPNPEQSSIQVDLDSATNSLKIKASVIQSILAKVNQFITSQN